MSEIDEVLDTLPRATGVREGMKLGREALVYVDHTGALCILIDEGGFLKIDERHLAYVKADVDPFMLERDE